LFYVVPNKNIRDKKTPIFFNCFIGNRLRLCQFNWNGVFLLLFNSKLCHFDKNLNLNLNLNHKSRFPYNPYFATIVNIRNISNTFLTIKKDVLLLYLFSLNKSHIFSSIFFLKQQVLTFLTYFFKLSLSVKFWFRVFFWINWSWRCPHERLLVSWKLTKNNHDLLI
jgi:hypothetical protein